MPAPAPVVVFVLDQYPVLSQTFVRNEVHALRGSGVDVRVLALQPEGNEPVAEDWAGPVAHLGLDGPAQVLRHVAWWARRHPVRLARCAVSVVRARRGRSVLARQLLGAARTLAGERVVACHTHFAWQGVPAVVALSHLLGCPSSATVHARDIFLRDGGLPGRLALLDRLVTVCRYNVDYLRRTGLYRRQVSVVPCGVHVPAEAQAPTAAPGRDVVTVARLVDKKGVLTLVEAFAAARERVPDATLTVLGDGPQRDDVDEAVARLGLGGHVRVLGAREHEETLARISGARVFALACQVDGEGDSDALPVVLREAMARARAIVTTAVAGIPELVDDETGWVVPPRDVDALAAALVEALTDDELAGSRGAAARRRTQASGTLDDTAAGMLDVLGVAS